MAKTAKELAFIREMFADENWSGRFADLIDKHVDLANKAAILYLNAGTGSHCLAIRERLDEKTGLFGHCEDAELLSIARDKAAAVGADVSFSTMRFDDDAFDLVLADASLVPPSELREFVLDAVRVTEPGGRLAFTVPAAGSFGEVFSLMWEVFLDGELGDAASVEALIGELPTLSQLEEMAKDCGLTSVKTQAEREVFEFENGTEFISSPLVADLLMPRWLGSLDEDEREAAIDSLGNLVDVEDGDLTFRFTVKAAIVSGTKA